MAQSDSMLPQLGVRKLVPVLSTALLTLSSIGLTKPANALTIIPNDPTKSVNATQFTLSGTLTCLLACPESLSTGSVKGEFSLDETSREIAEWFITTPLSTYQSGEPGQVSDLGFAASFFAPQANQVQWLTLFSSFDNPFSLSETILGSEIIEMVSLDGRPMDGSYWEGDITVARSSASVPEPSLGAGLFMTFLSGAWLKRKSARNANSHPST